MLAPTNRQLNSIFERIVRDKNGVLARVCFTIVEIDGKFQPQIISITPIVAAQAEKRETVCLPVLTSKTFVEYFFKPAAAPIVSPFYSLEFLFTSQPTRAPAF